MKDKNNKILKVGDIVTVVDGPYDGKKGKILTIKSSDSVVVKLGPRMFSLKPSRLIKEVRSMKESEYRQIIREELKKLSEGKYPPSKYENDDTFKYSFKIYMKDGEKHNTDFYDLAGAKKMKQILDKAKEEYRVSKWDGKYGDDVNLRSESIHDNSQNAKTMEKEIEKIAKKYFPKSYIDVYFSKNLLPHITIVFAIGQKKEWSNGIFQNDPMSSKMMIRGDGIDAEGNITGNLEFEPLMTSLTLKAPEGSHLAYGRVKSGVRKKKGDYKSIMKAVEVSFAKMKKTVKDNVDNLDDGHQWVKKYI